MAEKFDETDGEELLIPFVDDPEAKLARQGLASAAVGHSSDKVGVEKAPDTKNPEKLHPLEVLKSQLLAAIESHATPIKPGELFFRLYGISRKDARTAEVKRFTRALYSLENGGVITIDPETRYIRIMGKSYDSAEVSLLPDDLKEKVFATLAAFSDGVNKRFLFYEVMELNKSDATPQQTQVFNSVLHTLLASGAVVETEFEDPTITISNKSVRRLVLSGETTETQDPSSTESNAQEDPHEAATVKGGEPLPPPPQEYIEFSIPLNFRERIEELLELKAYRNGIYVKDVIRTVFAGREMTEQETRSLLLALNRLITVGVLAYRGDDHYTTARSRPGDEDFRKPRTRVIPDAKNELDDLIAQSGISKTGSRLPDRQTWE